MPAFKRVKVIGREDFPRGLLTNQLEPLKSWRAGRAGRTRIRKNTGFLGQRAEFEAEYLRHCKFNQYGNFIFLNCYLR